MNTKFLYSAGVWNLNTGGDPFGPDVRPERNFAEKAALLKRLGFDYIQLHDDDAVPMDVPVSETVNAAKQLKSLCDDHGLTVEFIAPRLWEDVDFADGAITSNSAASRNKGLDRAKRSVEIMNILGINRFVLWPAREGTYIREAKDAQRSFDYFLQFLNDVLDLDPNVRILGEMKPNEPMDLMYMPSTGHFLAMAGMTSDPSRVGVLIEAAHCILLGLDPSDEIAYALWHKKLWGVHLNDQNGLKYDQDKTFGSVDLRRAFNCVDQLVRSGYGLNGEIIGLDVKAMRTQPHEIAFKHLSNSKEIFERLVHLSATIDREEWQSYVSKRDYESLEMFIVRAIMKA